MNISVFNLSLLIGWLMVVLGVVMINVGAGLIVGGLLLLVLVFVVARIAGVFASQKKEVVE